MNVQFACVRKKFTVWIQMARGEDFLPGLLKISSSRYDIISIHRTFWTTWLHEKSAARISCLTSIYQTSSQSFSSIETSKNILEKVKQIKPNLCAWNLINLNSCETLNVNCIKSHLIHIWLQQTNPLWPQRISSQQQNVAKTCIVDGYSSEQPPGR